MRILVTGAEGFIGSHVLEALGGTPFVGDVASRAAWDRHSGDWDVVCHLAALVGTADSMRRPAAYVRANALGTAKLVESMSGRVGRVVLASSASVYGSVIGATEEAPVNPQSVYAVTKRMAEQLLLWSEIPTVILRPFAVYGPRQTNPDGGLVGIFARRLQAGKPILVTEDGGQLRELVEVSDVVEAFRLGLTGPVGIYNLAHGKQITVLDLARRLTALMDGPPPVVTGEIRPGDVRHITGAAGAGRDLGWKPQVSLHDGLQAYVESL